MFMRESVLALRRSMLMCLGVKCLMPAAFLSRGSDLEGREEKQANVANANG